MSFTPKSSSKSSSASSSNPSWNWLPPRPTAREMTGHGPAATAPVARPCLPAIEPLDDRILLSAATPTTDLKIADGTANTAVLIGLLKGGLDLIKGEVSALKLAVGGDETQIKGESTLKLLTDTFLKLDETLFKLGDAVMVGDVNGYKEQQLKLDTVFHKLGELVPESTGILPAVQRATDALIKNLGSLEGGDKVSRGPQAAEHDRRPVPEDRRGAAEVRRRPDRRAVQAGPEPGHQDRPGVHQDRRAARTARPAAQGRAHRIPDRHQGQHARLPGQPDQARRQRRRRALDRRAVHRRRGSAGRYRRRRPRVT
jgi:hypothetical protein